MNDDLPELTRAQRSAVVGDGLAELVSRPDGRALLADLAARCHEPIMNATKAELAEADRRAAHAREAVRLVFRFTWGSDCPTLGEFIRQLPPDVAESVADHLIRAGLS